MTKTIVGLFDNAGEAQRAVVQLVESGIAREDIGITSRDYEGYAGEGRGEGHDRDASHHDEGIGDKISNFFSGLFGDDEYANQYSEAVTRGGTVVTVGFYQGGAPELRLGEEWHHNRLEMVSSMGAWGAPRRHYPAWDRPRVMKTVVDMLATGQLDVEPFPARRFAFDDAIAASI